MTLFDQEFKKLIKREAGFVNHPADRGGPTNLGITLGTLTNYLGRQATVDDIKNLTTKTASEIYYQNYWLRYRISDLPELLQPIVFDMVVNSGKNGIKILQTALENHGYPVGKIDGSIGKNTASAATHAAAEMGNKLIETIVRRRIIYYQNIAKNDPSQEVFLNGWINRANEFLPGN